MQLVEGERVSKFWKVTKKEPPTAFDMWQGKEEIKITSPLKINKIGRKNARKLN